MINNNKLLDLDIDITYATKQYSLKIYTKQVTR
jgi:hypothetical protein